MFLTIGRHSRTVNMKYYFKQNLISLDQLLNTLLLGWADETFSSRSYREFPRLVPIIDTIFFFEENHCRESFISEKERRQLPIELRDVI